MNQWPLFAAMNPGIQKMTDLRGTTQEEEAEDVHYRHKGRKKNPTSLIITSSPTQDERTRPHGGHKLFSHL